MDMNDKKTSVIGFVRENPKELLTVAFGASAIVLATIAGMKAVGAYEYAKWLRWARTLDQATLVDMITKEVLQIIKT